MREPEFMFPSSSILTYFPGSGAHFFNDDGEKYGGGGGGVLINGNGPRSSGSGDESLRTMRAGKERDGNYNFGKVDQKI